MIVIGMAAVTVAVCIGVFAVIAFTMPPVAAQLPPTQVVLPTATPIPTWTPVPTTSPKAAYAMEIAPILDEISEWRNGSVAEMNAVFDEQIPGDVITAREFFMSGGIAYWDPSMMEPGSLADRLAEAARASANDGFQVLSRLGATTPVPQVKVAHESVAECVRFEVGRDNAVADMLELGMSRDIGTDYSCGTLDQSLAQLQAFVDEHK